MDTKFQTSFIPKRPVVGGAPANTASVRRPLNLVSMLATAVFLIALLAAGGLFAYSKVLAKQIASMEVELVAAKQSVETELLNEFLRLDSKMNSAENLLASHSAVSLVFEYLQNNTVRNVQYDDFNYSVSDLGVIEIALTGVAESYNAVALQSGIFAEDRNIKNPAFSDLDLDSSGNVVFSFKANINPELVSHRNTLGLTFFNQ